MYADLLSRRFGSGSGEVAGVGEQRWLFNYYAFHARQDGLVFTFFWLGLLLSSLCLFVYTLASHNKQFCLSRPPWVFILSQPPPPPPPFCLVAMVWQLLQAWTAAARLGLDSLMDTTVSLKSEGNANGHDSWESCFFLEEGVFLQLQSEQEWVRLWWEIRARREEVTVSPSWAQLKLLMNRLEIFLIPHSCLWGDLAGLLSCFSRMQRLHLTQTLPSKFPRVSMLPWAQGNLGPWQLWYPSCKNILAWHSQTGCSNTQP